MSNQEEREAGAHRIGDLVTESLQVFLSDRDVSEIRAQSSGGIQVVRRGRWERLQASLEPEIFEALERHAHTQAGDGKRKNAGVIPVAIDLPCAELRWNERVSGQEIWCHKHPPYDVTVDELVDSGVVSATDAESVLSHAAGGGGCLVLGPARYHTDRWVIALANALGTQRWMACARPGAEISWADCSLAPGQEWVEACRTQLLRGAEGLFTWGLSSAQFLQLCQARLGGLGIYGLRIASLEQLLELLDANDVRCTSAATQACVLGHDASGNMKLALHRFGAVPDNPLIHGRQDAPGVARELREVAPAQAPVVPNDPISAAPPSRPTSIPDAVLDDPFEGLPPLEPLPPGPPNAWASNAPNDDPGWELGGGNPVGTPSGAASTTGTPGESNTGFADVMNQVRARPTFQPRPPDPHPLARKLQTDPFGGLTLEPPAGEYEPAKEARDAPAGTNPKSEQPPEPVSGSQPGPQES